MVTKYDLRRLVDAANAGREATAHLVPVGIGSRDDDAELVLLRHLRGQDAGEVRALLARRGDVGDVVLDEQLRVVVGDHRHLQLRGEPRRARVVAARVRDDEVRPALGELAQHDVRLVVADVGRRLEAGACRRGRGLGVVDADLVPAVVVGLGRSRDLYVGDLGGVAGVTGVGRSRENAECHDDGRDADGAWSLAYHEELSSRLDCPLARGQPSPIIVLPVPPCPPTVGVVGSAADC